MLHSNTATTTDREDGSQEELPTPENNDHNNNTNHNNSEEDIPEALPAPSAMHTRMHELNAAAAEEVHHTYNQKTVHFEDVSATKRATQDPNNNNSALKEGGTPSPVYQGIQLVHLPAPPTTATQQLDFQTGLFQCTEDIPNAIDSLFCSCCVSGSHFSRLFHLQEGIYWPITAGLVCGDLCCGRIFRFPIIQPLFTVMVRQHLRKRYNLQGLGCWPSSSPSEDNNNNNSCARQGARIVLDILVSVCCMPCAIAQHHRQMTRRGGVAGEGGLLPRPADHGAAGHGH
ncbi:hypothetical protein AGDE_14808 [Angomonas deanei]|uniref:PLAC8 family, putative n=1 Tax=Angomonas deanei TaxID=59799 RepID=A0A7G2CMZ7_9TRYP|nr:hypothetical protein AGDE_14808 [Angomonas deanei]CAD2221220.1 PLAC8 family, putative [Angomonas deanei]|eukprot:EPY20187.1 hypothetical protein AGDE_14808 [Angomonas deanei]